MHQSQSWLLNDLPSTVRVHGDVNIVSMQYHPHIRANAGLETNIISAKNVFVSRGLKPGSLVTVADL